MTQNVTQKLVSAHLEHGSMRPGAPISIRIDQTLTQDATGTLVMLALEAMDLDRVKYRSQRSSTLTTTSCKTDNLNADDHLFLESACRRFGIWYSPPGNGISHVVHMQRFREAGQIALGLRQSYASRRSSRYVGDRSRRTGCRSRNDRGTVRDERCQKFSACSLIGALRDWVSAKDVILEMLRRRGVSGGVGKIIEYFGPGLALSGTMDRHVIANMDAELGATTTVFPSDKETRQFLQRQGRDG